MGTGTTKGWLAKIARLLFSMPDPPQGAPSVSQPSAANPTVQPPTIPALSADLSPDDQPPIVSSSVDAFAVLPGETAAGPVQAGEAPSVAADGAWQDLGQLATSGGDVLVLLGSIARDDLQERLVRIPLPDRRLLKACEPGASREAIMKAFAFIGGRFFRQVDATIVDQGALIELGIPANTIPTRREIVKHGRFTWRERLPKDVARDYKDLVAENARQAIHLTFCAVPGAQAVRVSLFKHMTRATRGEIYRGCILSVAVDRQGWEGIVHQHIPAENALRNFPLRFTYDESYAFREVVPLGRNEITDDGVSLKVIDPLRFEALIRELLAAMGYDQARLTKASHDGGIDIEAVNPKPIVGGKIVVQCKRYLSTVGAAAVRELYGAMLHAKAIKGILITTSDFSQDARRFAQDKPIDLINNRQLVELLRTHGFNVRAD